MRMLGATESQVVTDADRMLAEVASDLGHGDSFRKHTVGVYFGEPGKTVPDPYFDGRGPRRLRAARCAAAA